MNRLESLYADLAVQAMVITGISNIKYTCGFLADTAQVVIVADRKYYLTDSRFMLEAKLNLSADYEVINVANKDIFEVARELVGKAVKIGFDTDISHYQYLALEKAFTGCEIIDITAKILQLRAVKDDEEITCIIKAQRIAEKSLEELKPTIKIGVSEREIACKLDYLMKLNGSDENAFDTIVVFGENSALPHAKPSDRKLKVGDIILIDFGASYNGYRSDMTRTFIFGQCSEKIKEIYNIVLEANIATIKAIKKGMKCSDADAVARKIITGYGYGGNYIHSTGHGVGIDIHEEPYVAKHSRLCDTLTEGMIVTVEPGIYIEGLGGVRIEDMVVVKGDTVLNLTTVNKKLEILNI